MHRKPTVIALLLGASLVLPACTISVNQGATSSTNSPGHVAKKSSSNNKPKPNSSKSSSGTKPNSSTSKPNSGNTKSNSKPDSKPDSKPNSSAPKDPIENETDTTDEVIETETAKPERSKNPPTRVKPKPGRAEDPAKPVADEETVPSTPNNIAPNKPSGPNDWVTPN